MPRFLFICLAGALGTGARVLLSDAMTRAFGPAFPVGTLAVNVLGSFLICLLMRLGAHGSLLPETTRLVLTTGFLGGFTTYSSFDYQAYALARDGALGRAALYVSATLVLCFVAGALGDGTARALLRATS